MTDKQQSEVRATAAALEALDMDGVADFVRRLHVELETLRAKLKTHEDLGDAGSDVQLLRMGYAAARLEIESLKAQLAERADELAVAYMCGASRGKELAAPQPSPASQGDAQDAARYRYLRDGDWREHEKLESVIRLQLNTLWDKTIDAARAAQEGANHG